MALVMGLGWDIPDPSPPPDVEVVEWLTLTADEQLIECGYWSPAIQSRLDDARKRLTRRLAGVSDEVAERAGG